jgi:hypothetical protein
MYRKSLACRVCFPASVLALVVILAPTPTPAEENVDTSLRAFAILEENCANSGCHGGSNPYSFDARNPASLLAARVVEPGSAARSELIRRVDAGAMPMGGYKGQAGVKLPDADIQTLKRWIDQGAPTPVRSAANARPFLSESEVLASIIQDLEATPKADRPHRRYYSIANLWNAADVTPTALESSRAAVGKLANHLSWKPEIVKPVSVGNENAILRIDLRDYGWTDRTWERIVAGYPYAAVANDLRDKAAQIRALSGAIVPYLRADWFVANASVSPLYDDILRLPNTVDDLESQLKVNIAANTRTGRAQRFGVRNSGISRNNRVMERNPTPYGAYWKSFDFAGNLIEQNIFRDPIHLTPDGGEIIFNLPNGLQAYMIVNALGKSIDDAPITIVRDRTNPDDPVVHNGRSCIGCHIKGTNAFQDEISDRLQDRVDAVFDVDRAAALYPGQPALDRVLQQDNKRFIDALNRSGNGIPTGSQEEPVNQLARRHEAALSVADAAAELYISDPQELQRLIGKNVELQRQGFDQLMGATGGIKRDTWEQGFSELVEELGLGNSLLPNKLARISAGTKLPLKLETALNTRIVRRGDEVMFRTAQDLRAKGNVMIPMGSIVRAVVSGIQRADGTAQKANVQFQLDEVRLTNGTTMRLPASIVTIKEIAHAPMAPMAHPMPPRRNDGVWSEKQTKGQMISQAIAIVSESIRNASGPPPAAPQPQQAADIPQGSMFEARF